MKRRDFLRTAGATALLAGFTANPLFANNARQPLGYLRTNWSRDPFSFGSYSYFAKGASLEDRVSLAAPWQNTLFFAGEAANTDYNSTVHAAYESGRFAASAILARSDTQKVAVIGAGISGLAAAQRLAKHGLQVTVFEARERLGGRLWTSNALGPRLDLGASWIHGTEDNPLVPLARRQGMASVATDDAWIARGEDGRELTEEALPNWLEEVGLVQHNAGADLSQIDLSLSQQQADNDYGGEEVIFPEGYAPILDALKGEYAIQLKTAVTRLETSEKQAVVVTSQGKVVFDAVLLTVPLGVLKAGSIEFAPPLPDWKTQAIQRLGMGTLDKVYLQYDSAFWDRDVTWIVTPENGLPRGQFNGWLNLYKYFQIPVIMAFNGGSPALDLAGLSDSEVLSRAIATLDKAYPQR